MYELFKDDVLPWYMIWINILLCMYDMILCIYAVPAYVSTYLRHIHIWHMTGEHGIHWMMMIVLILCVYIFMELYGKYFCCICCDSSEFPSFSCSRSDVYSWVYVCYHYALILIHFLRLTNFLLWFPHGFRSYEERV